MRFPIIGQCCSFASTNVLASGSPLGGVQRQQPLPSFVFVFMNFVSFCGSCAGQVADFAQSMLVFVLPLIAVLLLLFSFADTVRPYDPEDYDYEFSSNLEDTIRTKYVNSCYSTKLCQRKS